MCRVELTLMVHAARDKPRIPLLRHLLNVARIRADRCACSTGAHADHDACRRGARSSTSRHPRPIDAVVLIPWRSDPRPRVHAHAQDDGRPCGDARAGWLLGRRARPAVRLRLARQRSCLARPHPAAAARRCGRHRSIASCWWGFRPAACRPCSPRMRRASWVTSVSIRSTGRAAWASRLHASSRSPHSCCADRRRPATRIRLPNPG